MTILNNIKRAPGYIKKVTGSYLSPELSSLKLVICPVQKSKTQTLDIFNNVSRRWISVDSKMKEWFVGQRKFELGNIQDIAVQSDTWIVLAMVYDANGNFDKSALKTALVNTTKLAIETKGSIHISDEILNIDDSVLDIFKEAVVNEGVNLTIYKTT
jgi:hypothetical protein